MLNPGAVTGAAGASTTPRSRPNRGRRGGWHRRRAVHPEQQGPTVRIFTYAGIIQSLEVPDRRNERVNVVLRSSDLQGYLCNNNLGPYFIADGQFELDGNTDNLPINKDPNSLHGGVEGFDTTVWAATPIEGNRSVDLQPDDTSVDGEEGYRGNHDVQVSCTLTREIELGIHCTAPTDAPTVVNRTNHVY